MAMLASKTALSSTLGSGSASSQLQAARDYASAPGSRRTPLPDTANHGTFASPTESEFSETFEGPDSVRSWDEKQVGDWLKSIGCGMYASKFKENNVNGSNLIECDQAVLKEMGIQKIGDRVRIFVGIKALRNKSIPNQKKRNRESIATLDMRSTMSSRASGSAGGSGSSSSYTHHLREHSIGGGRSNRYSMQFLPGTASLQSPAFPHPSPKTEGRSGQSGYFPIRRPETPSEAGTVKGTLPKRGDAAAAAAAAAASKMPSHKEFIRVISGSQTKILDITGWKTAEEVMNTTLRKMNRPDASARNFCFFVHEPTENPNNCRKLSETDLLDILRNPQNKLKSRLILRTIHSGSPSADELEKSHEFHMEEIKQDHEHAMSMQSRTNRSKLERVLGERPDLMKAPLSPVVPLSLHNPVSGEQRRAVSSLIPATLPDTKLSAAPKQDKSAVELDAWSAPQRADSSSRKQPMRKVQGNRPPSELISHDLQSYFTDHEAKDLERTMSMAQRRSARVSKALSRLSMASTFSVKEAMKDAPALPSIPTNFLDYDPFANSGGASGRSGRPLSVWRQSVALPSVKEDDANMDVAAADKEPNRKSYLSIKSIGDDAKIAGGTLVPTLPPSSSSSTADGDDDTASVGTYLEDGTVSSTGGQSMLNEQYREAIKADGEEQDEQLDSFLNGNTFEEMSWMQGDLIGQGSFGSVYLALHAVTGELMAVKQVEMPGRAGADAALERRKQSMLAALQREIKLLSELQHEHIVQYLGVGTTEQHLNIFLEYVPGGSVASMLNNYGHLKEPLIRNLVRQTLDGLMYLHNRDIIHRDIKGANILVDNKGKVKISDFGISKKVDLQSASSGTGSKTGKGANKRVSMQGSVFWMAPEVVKQTSYTRKADIWSLGALIVEMFTGEHPYPKLNQMQVIFRLGGHVNQKPEIPADSTQEAKDFLSLTFEIDENSRPEAAELLKLPFMKIGSS